MDFSSFDLNIPIDSRITSGGVAYRKDRSGNYEILIIQRTFDDGVEDWTLPKGGLEDGESLQENAVREIEEETGYRCETERFIGQYQFSIFHELRNRYYIGIMHFFACRLISDEQGVQTNPENTTGVEWLPLDEVIEKVSFDEYKDVLRDFKKLYKQGV